MTGMVERVARALFKQSVYHGYNEDTLKFEWRRTASLHRAAACAAIEAMRRPTAKMLEAGAEGSGEDSETVAFGAWEAMLDAALQEGKEGE